MLLKECLLVRQPTETGRAKALDLGAVSPLDIAKTVESNHQDLPSFVDRNRRAAITLLRKKNRLISICFFQSH